MLRECMIVDWLDVLGLLQITTTTSAVTPQWSPPSPRCYRNSHPQYRGITANFTSVTADFLRLPRYYRCPHYRAALYSEATAPRHSTNCVLLGCVGLVAQQPIVVKLSRNDLSVGPCVGRSVCLSSTLWKNGGSDPDAIWHLRSDGSRDEAGSGVWESVHGKGYFWGQSWGTPL